MYMYIIYTHTHTHSHTYTSDILPISWDNGTKLKRLSEHSYS